MISLNQVSVIFGGFQLFKDVGFLVSQNDRIGLVGKNGAGKSTLLKLLIGEMKPTSGIISIPNDIRIGYLPQQMILSNKRSVIEETLLAFEESNRIRKEIKAAERELSERLDHESEEYLALIEKFTHLNDRYSLIGSDSDTAFAEQALLGLGFRRTDFSRQTKEFSGGWRMRIELAKILLRKPDILLLDEPTNHLDIESIQWLEDYLCSYPGALILISHDRAFLDTVTDRTVELSLGKAFDYRVNYSKYVELRRERREQQLAAYRNQQKLIEDTQDFIDRFRSKATKAIQVQSRIKQLGRLEIIEVDDEDLATLRIKFPKAPRAGDIVCESKGVAKAFGNHTVFSEVDFIINRGEKVALVGRNGEGKTTMSRIITGDLDFTGHLKIGHNVTIGYFAQNQDELLNESLTVLETIDHVATGDIRARIRDILGAFLFRGEDVDKKVKVLSGGERNRLAMAKLMLQPYNLLVLDEPTNHLDMRSKDLLKDALKKYDGTLIIVSHDRDFLNGLVNKVYEFSNGRVKEHLGGIFEFLRKRKLDTLKELERKSIEKSDSGAKAESVSKLAWMDRKELDRQLRKLLNSLKELEKRIGTLESEIAGIDLILSKPDEKRTAAIDSSLFTMYEGLKAKLEASMTQWEALSTEVENLKQQRV